MSSKAFVPLQLQHKTPGVFDFFLVMYQLPNHCLEDYLAQKDSQLLPIF